METVAKKSQAGASQEGMEAALMWRPPTCQSCSPLCALHLFLSWASLLLKAPHTLQLFSHPSSSGLLVYWNTDQSSSFIRVDGEVDQKVGSRGYCLCCREITLFL